MGRFLSSRAWVVIEPVFLLVVFGLAARQLTPFFGVDATAAESALSATPPDWGVLSGIEGKSLSIKWGLLLAAAFVIALARKVNPLRPASGAPVRSPIRLAVIGAAFSLPFLTLSLLPRWYHFHVEPLGETPPIWDLIYSAPFSMEFFVFMAISSFILVPIVEEIFFRGYFFGTLLKKFRPRGAIVLSAIVFSVVHLQYAAFDAFSLYNMGMVFVVSAAYAWLVLKTKTLLPAIVGHGFANFPIPLGWAPFLPIVAIPAAVLAIRELRHIDR